MHFLSFPSHALSLPLIVLFDLILRYFGSENLILYQNTINMATNLDVPINYLNTINCTFDTPKTE